MGLLSSAFDAVKKATDQNNLATPPDILGAKVPGSDQTVAQAGTTAYDPTLRTVNADTETVSAQLDRILGKDSPYMTRARAGSQEYANSRGLLNTTMSGQAGEAAAIDAALPIATADANVYGTAARENQAFSNTAGQFNAGASNTSALNASQAANASILSGQEAKQQTGLIAAQGAQTRETQAEGVQAQKELAQQSAEINTALQTLKGTQATDLTNIEANYKQLIQTNQSATSFYTNGMSMLAAIMANTDTSAEQKQAGVDKITALMNGGLQLIGSIGNIDLSAVLDWQPA